jgi:hypothetical protein
MGCYEGLKWPRVIMLILYAICYPGILLRTIQYFITVKSSKENYSIGTLPPAAHAAVQPPTHE